MGMFEKNKNKITATHHVFFPCSFSPPNWLIYSPHMSTCHLWASKCIFVSKPSTAATKLYDLWCDGCVKFFVFKISHWRIYSWTKVACWCAHCALQCLSIWFGFSDICTWNNNHVFFSAIIDMNATVSYAKAASAAKNPCSIWSTLTLNWWLPKAISHADSNAMAEQKKKKRFRNVCSSSFKNGGRCEKKRKNDKCSHNIVTAVKKNKKNEICRFGARFTILRLLNFTIASLGKSLSST